MLLTVAVAMVSCETTPQALIDRNNRILQEPRGDYWIGRRVCVKGTRFWGYVRRPGQLWESGQLVIMNERIKRTPDRLPEGEDSESHFQFDVNREYQLKGRLTGRKPYDPNSNQILPEFLLEDWRLVDKSPGFIFHPREKKNWLGVPVPRN
jgi:hypothetical protein